MDSFIRRPAASAGIAFFVCALVLSFVPGHARIVGLCALGAFCVAVVLWAIFGKRLPVGRDVRLFVCSVLAGTALAGLVFPAAEMPFPENAADVRAVVTERLWSFSSGGVYSVRVVSVDGKAADVCAAAKVYDPSVIAGDVIEGEAVFAPLGEEYGNSERYVRSRGMVCAAEFSDVRYVGSASSAGISLALFREQIGSRIDAGAGEYSGFVKALVTGDRSGVSDGVRLDFAELGASHLMAISGLHMTVLTATLMMFLSPFGKRKRVLVIPVILFYTAITGFAPSAVRAGVMLTFGCVLSLFGRRSDTLTVLWTAVMLICLADPGTVYDVGFLLSVSAVCGLIWKSAVSRRREADAESADRERLAEILNDPSLGAGEAARLYEEAKSKSDARRKRAQRRREAHGVRRFVRVAAGAAFTSAAASVFVLPITAWEFGYVSVFAPAANLIFIPLVTLFMYTMPAYAISLLSPVVSSVTGKAAGAFAGVIVRLADIATRYVGLTVSLDYPFFLELSVLLVFSLIAYACAKKRRIALAAVVICAAAMVTSASVYEAARSGVVSVSMDTASAGDLIYVTDGADCAVVDSTRGYASASRVVSEHLRTICATDVEAYVFTHYHSRAPVYLRALAGDIRLRSVWLPEPADDAERLVCRRLKEVAQESGVEVHMISSADGGFGGALRFGDAVIGISERYSIPRSTEPLFAVQVIAGDGRAVYLPSAFTEAGELFGEECAVGGADVYFLGTHGPKPKAKFVPPDGFAPEVIVFGGDSDGYFPAKLGEELYQSGCVFVREGYTAKWEK